MKLKCCRRLQRRPIEIAMTRSNCPYVRSCRVRLGNGKSNRANRGIICQSRISLHEYRRCRDYWPTWAKLWINKETITFVEHPDTENRESTGSKEDSVTANASENLMRHLSSGLTQAPVAARLDVSLVDVRIIDNKARQNGLKPAPVKA